MCLPALVSLSATALPYASKHYATVVVASLIFNMKGMFLRQGIYMYCSFCLNTHPWLPTWIITLLFQSFD